MYSEELMTYLYSYNLSSESSKKKDEEKKVLNKKAFSGETPLLHVLKSASVTVPVDFNHDAF